jgi:hypothetical protein
MGLPKCQFVSSSLRVEARNKSNRSVRIRMRIPQPKLRKIVLTSAPRHAKYSIIMVYLISL